MKQKIILFAVLPLVVALCAIALVVRYHAISLAQQQRDVIKPAYLAMKDAELKNYVEFATRAISHLYESGRTDAQAKQEAKAILEKMDDGKDNYLFLYSLDGTLLMHPKQKGSVEENMWTFQDPAGKLLIQDLIRIAQAGGGFENYVWPKYSTGSPDPKPKRAYVIALPEWGWMLGTGVYLDDVDNALSEIDTQVSRNIEDTMLWIAGIAFLAAVVIFLGLMRNIRERTALDDKLGSANAELEVLADELSFTNAELEVLANKLSLANAELTSLAKNIMSARDNERERIKDELHDGIQQKLFATQMQLETAVDTLPKISHAPSQALQTAKELLKEALIELRKIVNGIIDPELDLKADLTKLALNMSPQTSVIKFNTSGEIKDITIPSKKALELFAREALVNIVKHAEAHQIEMRLEGSPKVIKLEICDDGRGFDVNDSNKGHGLRNMRQRLQSVGGQLLITSSSKGSCLTGTIPLT